MTAPNGEFVLVWFSSLGLYLPSDDRLRVKTDQRSEDALKRMQARCRWGRWAGDVCMASTSQSDTGGKRRSIVAGRVSARRETPASVRRKVVAINFCLELDQAAGVESIRGGGRLQGGRRWG